MFCDDLKKLLPLYQNTGHAENTYIVRETSDNSRIKEVIWINSDFQFFDTNIAKDLTGFFSKARCTEDASIFSLDCDGAFLVQGDKHKYLFLNELKSTFDSGDIYHASNQIVSTYIKLNMILNLLPNYQKQDVKVKGFIFSHPANKKYLRDLYRESMGKKGFIFLSGGFNEVVRNLHSKYRIYAPVLKVGEGRFTDTDVVRYEFVNEAADIEWEKKSDYSFKEILTPLSQTLFFFTEFSGLDIKTRVLSSLFQAVTPRTAGFNTIDYTKFSDNGIAMTVILMLIGGGSGSTAGGIKMSTVFILAVTMCSILKQDKEVAVFKKRIEPDIIKNAVAVLFLDVALFIAGSMLISGIEGFSLKETMFESASAVATVGLTLGITPSLGTVSKLLLICMMYIGRVGGITLIFAAVTPKNNGNARYPKDQVAVG